MMALKANFLLLNNVTTAKECDAHADELKENAGTKSILKSVQLEQCRLKSSGTFFIQIVK